MLSVTVSCSVTVGQGPLPKPHAAARARQNRPWLRRPPCLTSAFFARRARHARGMPGYPYLRPGRPGRGVPVVRHRRVFDFTDDRRFFPTPARRGAFRRMTVPSTAESDGSWTQSTVTVTPAARHRRGSSGWRPPQVLVAGFHHGTCFCRLRRRAISWKVSRSRICCGARRDIRELDPSSACPRGRPYVDAAWTVPSALASRGQRRSFGSGDRFRCSRTFRRGSWSPGLLFFFFERGRGDDDAVRVAAITDSQRR